MKKLVRLCAALLLVLLLFCGCSQPQNSQSQKAETVLKELSEQMVKNGYTDFTDYLEMTEDVDKYDGSVEKRYIYTVNDACEFEMWKDSQGFVAVMCVAFDANINTEDKEEMKYLMDCIINMFDPDYHDEILKELGDYSTLKEEEQRTYNINKRTYMYTPLDQRIMFLLYFYRG